MTISKKNLYILVYLGIFMPLLARFFTDNFGLPYFFMPIFDLWFIIILFLAYTFKCKKHKDGVLYIERWMFTFLTVMFLSIIVNGGTSITDFFYNSRPYLRMICAILVATLSLQLFNYDRLYRFIRILLYVNVLIMIYQFIFMGLRQDIIGGTFGNNQGVNSIQNLLCVFFFTISIVKYLYKKVKFSRLLADAIVTLVIATLAEINFYYLEFVSIAVLAFILNKHRYRRIPLRKIILVVGGVFLVIVALILFLKINPERAFLLSLDNILEYLGAKESTGVYRISRIKVFSQLGDNFFGNDIRNWIFGYGVGNCSTHSHFYSVYKNLQYDYFSSSFVFLESGLIGVFVNLGIIVYSAFISFKYKKRCTNEIGKIWYDISIIFSFILMMLFFYNSTLRDIYTAFLCGIMIALPFVTRGEKNDTQKDPLYLAGTKKNK